MAGSDFFYYDLVRFSGQHKLMCLYLKSQRILSVSLSLMVRLIANFRGFPSRCLNYSFHLWRLSSWLAAFTLALKVFFVSLISFTNCYVICDCLFSTQFRILLIWIWMYCSNYFCYVLITSLRTFISFRALTLFCFFYYVRMLFWAGVHVIYFFLTAINSQETLHSALGLISLLLLSER